MTSCKFFPLLAGVVSLASFPQLGCAQNNIQQPTATLSSPSTSLLPEDAFGAFKLSGRDQAKGQFSVVPATHPDFKQAIRAQTLEAVSQPFALQLSARTVKPVVKGDTLFVSLWMRTLRSPMDEGFVGFTFEQGQAPYKRSIGVESSAGGEWKLLNFPFKAADSYAAGEAIFNLRLGYLPQTIEIGGLSLRDFGPNVPLESLPTTSSTYAGREANAPWRKAAQERIEKIRKADVRIRVQDARGRPLSGASVEIEQTRHAFAFGSAVGARALLSKAPDDVRYQQMVRGLFNKVVLENDLKWRGWNADRDTPQRALSWLRDAGIDVRGHVLVWPSWRHSPDDLQLLKTDSPGLQKRIADHITDEVSTLRGQVVEWDVLNEPFDNHDVMDITGPGVQADWFRLAHEADGGARLYLNDYNILEGGGMNAAHQGHFEDTIRFLLDQKAPLDGIGIQGHFGWNLTPPERMLAILDRFSKFGKPIEITEFDVQVTDEKLQADFTRDFLTTMFSHPNVNGVVMWGFWEGLHYSPSAALWRKNWTPKPNAEVWLDLVKHQWWTHETKVTGADGALSTRAFLGDYRIKVTSGAKTIEKTFTLTKDGHTETITLS